MIVMRSPTIASSRCPAVSGARSAVCCPAAILILFPHNQHEKTTAHTIPAFEVGETRSDEGYRDCMVVLIARIIQAVLKMAAWLSDVIRRPTCEVCGGPVHEAAYSGYYMCPYGHQS